MQNKKKSKYKLPTVEDVGYSLASKMGKTAHQSH